jgi:uncharacterized protein YcgL (UPF0745 family)
MLCAVYKSIKKPETYLFIAKRDDFSPVPDALLTQFGTPQLVSILNIQKDSKLAQADAQNVRTSIIKNGYYLQLPPPPVDYLKEHKKWQEQQKGKTNDLN